MLKKIIVVFSLLLLLCPFFVANAEEISTLKGDINGNGVINTIDLNLLSEKWCSSSDNMEYKSNEDVNDDGVVNDLDVESLKMSINSLKIHGFYPKEIFKAKNSNQKHFIKYFEDLSFALYDITYDTTNIENNEIIINSPHSNEDYIEALKISRENEVPIRFNLFSDMRTLKNILPFEEKRKQLIQMTVDIMNEEVFEGTEIYWNGLVIDFEQLKNTGTNPINGIKEDILYNGRLMSEHYTQFLQELKQAIYSQGMKKDLYVAVPYSTYYNGYNYREIGNIADKVIVMAHDYEPKKSIKKSDVMLYLNNPTFVNTIAPIDKIENAINTLTNSETGIQDPKKIILQISFGTAQWKFPNIENAEDWQQTSLVTTGVYSTPSYGQIYQRMISEIDPGIPNYIKPLESPYMEYYNSIDKSYNFILYEDSRSVTEKIKRAKDSGIGGISIWSLGRIPEYEDIVSTNGTRELYLDIWSKILETIKFESNK